MRGGIGVKLLAAVGVVIFGLAAVGFIGWQNTVTFSQSAAEIYEDGVVMSIQLARIQRGLYELRLGGSGQAYHTANAEKRVQILKADEGWLKQVDDNMSALMAASSSPREAEQINAWHEIYPTFLEARKRTIALVDAGKDAEANTQRTGETAALLQQAILVTEKLLEIQDIESTAVNAELVETSVTSKLLLSTAILLSLMLGGGLALYVTRSITLSVREVTDAVRGLAAGDIEQEVTYRARDELGEMADAVRTMIVHQREMARAAQSIASGDLTTEIHPASDRDVLGHAFVEMIGGLNGSITNVNDAAVTLTSTSHHLGRVADEVTNVVEQVAQAISQIATNAQEQAVAAVSSNKSVARLRESVEQVSRGAAEQTRSVSEASVTTERMANGVEQVAANAKSLAAASQQTRASAEQGAQAVQRTVSGMAEIHAVVSQASDRVEDLGRLGERIGLVVETIDDIAEQTNLLALNAAIEAARAGEHGRGFAVVADEVRKLAERSQRETKAISDLIRDVQSGTREAVTAMALGTSKVNEGSAEADQAGRALDEILTAMESTVQQIEVIAAAAQDMAGQSRAASETMQVITATAEETTAASEAMIDAAHEVGESIGSITANSAQNSAATEEVSAAAEEMTAQIQQMSDQSQALARTAEQLQALVARFTLEAQALAGQPALRRRAEDWGAASGASKGARRAS
ncbi:MAG: methyl-accepting chemotaxis protein [Chloroflexi bacterium]|nr:methyl-accepting chemotaxis protein [Chloroflexota bacterium]